MTEIDQQFVEYIVKSLVSKPEAVSIARSVDDRGVLLELTVDGEDLGRIIGKRGATAQSLRTLLRALGTKNEARYNLKIVDVNGGGTTTVPAADDDAQTTNDTADTAAAAPADEPDEEQIDESSTLAKTRRELAELDDLDV